MIKYTIKRVHPLHRTLSAMFEKEGEEVNYHGTLVLPMDFTEEDIMHALDVLADEATRYWTSLANVGEVTVSNMEGNLPEVVYVPHPQKTDEFLRDYDPAYQKVEPLVTKTETTKTHGWQIIDKTDAEIGQEVRHKRDAYLRQTDIYAWADREMPEEIRVYRQALRDIPSQEGFPRNVTWPVQPVE